MLRRATAAALITVAAVALTSCTGEEKVSEGKTPTEVLELAKKTLDETSGVHIALSGDLPDGTTGISSADGVATHAPAFDGSITVVVAGQELEVPVISVDGDVQAKLPFTLGWSDVDPADYGAPDPAQLLATDGGFSGLVTATEGAEEGDTVRGGEGNKQVLTEYTGTVPGEAVKAVIPSASGDFDAVYTISSEGQLVSMRLTGDFYPGSDAMTYTVDLDDYGSDPGITAP